ncbi:Cytochrome c oxidase, subunit I [Candidatus Methylobacter favarea]|uniref:Cytochrome c oxidase, subunit I n=1 Tax=Candidatus Methylobacter favarea TaxID=2707345 RepID=A0A8S0WJP9_9GAMM|nr:cbb3-type cytochrome c oxidase subunit I [Candidatus Methylobacter favarea]CAA9891468.1 Cytochrome c oxidase, subunit I [Candidatus Methylobacter favarea]
MIKTIEEKAALPNTLPRPQGEEEELLRIWETPKGWRWITAVNNTVVGLLYLGAAFAFFVLAGLLALVMRTQLAVPENDLVSQDLYNQIFTVHGTTMMFLFAVPAMEALGVLLLPQMLAARDLPFPRLSAFAVWAYIIGGSVFFSTVFYGLAPKGGWFMYPPLTLTAYSPGDNADFWLLGIGFIEISAIAGAIEIIVGILRTRPPGMSLDKLPIFGWSMLVFAGMIVVAFPAVILATMFLEIERSFGWPFFTASGGGDPLLWQHLFWFFGHPEVYIIFLPAAGLVSMIVPTMAHAPLIGYKLIVVALIATGFFSFGLWVHHMFATGIPALSLAFFSAASMAVAVPSGIQVFSWIATIASAKGGFQLNTPSLFVLGMLFIFTVGGLTGIMVAMVPFDWQAHDTHFIVAHLHYVLVGGMVFPLFATFYYWAPMVSTRMLSERLGKWLFWLMFIGFNVTFLHMHITGLIGMPHRVWTYSEASGWGPYNFISTVGAYILGAGVLIFIIDLIRNFRVGKCGVTNPWQAGTLEWLPTDVYSTRSIPHVTSREPLWEQPGLAEQVSAGEHYLPNAPTGARETIVTSAIEATPQYVIQMPGNGWAHVLAAVFTAACFLLLTIKVVAPALACAVLAIACCLAWVWELDKGSGKGPVAIGAGLKLPVYVTGPMGHGWWAMVILMLVAGALYFAYLFSYLYLWTVSPEVWPSAAQKLPALQWPAMSALLFVSSAAFFAVAKRTLPEPGKKHLLTPLLLLLGALSSVLAVCLEIWCYWQTGLRPTASSYEAMVYMDSILAGQLVFAMLIMALFVIARHFTGKLDRVRSATLENTNLLAYYTVAQALIGLLIIHGFPRMIL